MPLQGLRFRPAESEDLAAIRAIAADVLEAEEASGDVGVARWDGASGCRCPNLCSMLVAEQKGELVGYIAWREDEMIAVVGAHAVRADRRGWGVGAGLLRALLRRFRLAGIRLIEVRLARGARGMQRIYEGLGFGEIGRSVRMVRRTGGRAEAVLVPAEEAATVALRRRAGYDEAAVWLHYEKRYKLT